MPRNPVSDERTESDVIKQIREPLIFALLGGQSFDVKTRDVMTHAETLAALLPTILQLSGWQLDTNLKLIRNAFKVDTWPKDKKRKYTIFNPQEITADHLIQLNQRMNSFKK